MINGAASSQGDASAVAAQTIDSIVLSGAPTGYVGPLVLSPTDKGATWATSISAAGFSNPADLVKNYMAVGDYIVPLNGSCTTYLKVA